MAGSGRGGGDTGRPCLRWAFCHKMMYDKYMPFCMVSLSARFLENIVSEINLNDWSDSAPTIQVTDDAALVLFAIYIKTLRNLNVWLHSSSPTVAMAWGPMLRFVWWWRGYLQ